MIEEVCVVGCYESGLKSLCEEHLFELEDLLYSCDLKSKYQFLCPIRKVNPATFIGSGKVDEIKQFLTESGIKTVVFDDELLPSQQRNLEKILSATVMDRAEVILNVFSRKAQTKEAKLQVDLAKIKYSIPRLKRLWTHLSRQRGGGVNQKGEGEAQLELDKRLLKQREIVLKRELEEVKSQRETRRSSKQRNSVFNFTIVGYTNAGKSSLMNLLTGASVLSEDRLFATLDTTTRSFKLPNGTSVILTDTVGFIRKLPHFLVSSFRSTLEESLGADCLIKLVDISNQSYKSHIETIDSVLKSLGCKDSQKSVMVFNKSEMVDETVINQAKLLYPDSIFCSVKDRVGIDNLLNIMGTIAIENNVLKRLKIPLNEYEKMHVLHEIGSILEKKFDDEFAIVDVFLPKEKEHMFFKFEDTKNI